MTEQKDRYVPHFDPKGETDPTVALYRLQEEFRKIWEAVHQLHGKLDTIMLLNSLSVNGSVTATSAINTEDSVSLGNYIEISQREYNASGVLTPGLAPSGTCRIYFDKVTQKAMISENLGAYVNII